MPKQHPSNKFRSPHEHSGNAPHEPVDIDIFNEMLYSSPISQERKILFELKDPIEIPGFNPDDPSAIFAANFALYTGHNPVDIRGGFIQNRPIAVTLDELEKIRLGELKIQPTSARNSHAYKPVLWRAIEEELSERAQAGPSEIMQLVVGISRYKASRYVAQDGGEGELFEHQINQAARRMTRLVDIHDPYVVLEDGSINSRYFG
jgi:hypothetical protein